MTPEQVAALVERLVRLKTEPSAFYQAATGSLLASTITALRQMQADGKDAERYRWLREGGDYDELSVYGPEHPVKWESYGPRDRIVGAELDRTIDAAMQPKP